jgi:exopolysaccharide biosynthesis predicted pyruvyltransferase EpsI/N-acetylglutamate synthase-like GNAT family acetyltransferase
LRAEPASARVAALSGQIDSVLGPLIPRGEPVALLDFPSYPNVGDSAIWLGELAWLERNGNEIRYVASHRDYSPAAARRRAGGATILLSGGGNLGDAYPWHQRLRERAIADFASNRIVQLPQSASFSSEAALRGASEALRAHRDLTVIARDRPSLDLLSGRLGMRTVLCPDMAFCLGSLRRRGPASHELLAVLRTDEHSAIPTDALGRDVPVADWVAGHGPADGSRLLRVIKPVEVAAGHLGGLAAALSPALEAAYRRYAELRLGAGLRLLSSAGAVVTDRLHAGILCLLLDIPHVLLDDRSGKLSGFHDAWLTGIEGCEIADSPRRAVEAARRPATAGAATESFRLRPARPADREAILAVMETANMHRLDSPEMPSFEIDRFVVAEADGRIVGAAGWQLLDGELAKTTLLAVLPAAGGRGVGSALQRARMSAMRLAGATRVRTNADRPETIAWYKRHFGYREVGTLAKEDDFGDPEVDRWVTLEADLG